MAAVRPNWQHIHSHIPDLSRTPHNCKGACTIAAIRSNKRGFQVLDKIQFTLHYKWMDGIDSSNRAIKDACIHQYGPFGSMQNATDAHAIDSRIDSPISLQAIAKRSRSLVVLILCDAVSMTRHWNSCHTRVVSSSSPVFPDYRTATSTLQVFSSERWM